MAKLPAIKPPKAMPAAGPNPMMPGGGSAMTSPADQTMAQPKAPGGSPGFLINPGKFSDSHAGPPSARGQKKSQGYPSFTQNP